MYEAFRRVRYVDDGELTDEELIEQLQQRRQVLCVVNSRRQAQALFHALGEAEGTFHLSTLLTPFDRKRILQEIRIRLQERRDCRVISTSLIEAGVDVDFPEVYRGLAGLDSIIQSGGRCNREGKRPAEESVVHIFRSKAKSPRMLEQNISATERTLERFEQADSPEAINSYFDFLFYTLKDNKALDEKGIVDDAIKLRFKTVSEHFKLIEGADCTVYIPIGEGERLIQEIRRFGPSRGLMRKLGLYGVSVYHGYFSRLCDICALEIISDNAGILLKPELYSPETGLPFEVSEQSQAIFI